MSNKSWWRRLLNGIDHEYERRIRAASKVNEYGAHHHHADHDDDDGEAAEIMNVPRGAPVRRNMVTTYPSPASPPDQPNDHQPH